MKIKDFFLRKLSLYFWSSLKHCVSYIETSAAMHLVPAVIEETTTTMAGSAEEEEASAEEESGQPPPNSPKFRPHNQKMLI
jgi:hypothetical protein